MTHEQERLDLQQVILAATNDPMYRCLLGECRRLERVIIDVDRLLRVDAAEYVPAIGDVFTLIDKECPGLVDKE